jgi:hypothetical protein
VIHSLTRQLDAVEHLIGHVGEGERVAVDEEELLLEPDRERLGATEPVRGDWARGVGRRRARGVRAAHGVSPSAARAAIRPKTSAAASPLA